MKWIPSEFRQWFKSKKRKEREAQQEKMRREMGEKIKQQTREMITNALNRAAVERQKQYKDSFELRILLLKSGQQQLVGGVLHQSYQNNPPEVKLINNQYVCIEKPAKILKAFGLNSMVKMLDEWIDGAIDTPYSIHVNDISQIAIPNEETVDAYMQYQRKRWAYQVDTQLANALYNVIPIMDSPKNFDKEFDPQEYYSNSSTENDSDTMEEDEDEFGLL